MPKSGEKKKAKKAKKERHDSKSPDRKKKKKSRKRRNSEMDKKIDEILFGSSTTAPALRSVVSTCSIGNFQSSSPLQDSVPSESQFSSKYRSEDSMEADRRSDRSNFLKSVAVAVSHQKEVSVKECFRSGTSRNHGTQPMSVAVLPVYNRPKSVERSDRLQVDHDDARWAHDHYREESSPTRSRNLYELMKNNPKCSYFSHEHDDRWKASSSRSHLSPAKDRNFHNIVRKDRKSTRSNNIVSQQRFSFGKEDGPVVPIKSSFPGRMTTGYHFQHDNTEGSKRSMSPIEPGQMLGSHIDSPPRGMPDHLRWLHSRWKKYDKTTFEKNFGSRAAAVFEQMQKGDKSRWKNVTGTSAFTTITKGSWEEDYLKELEETDPFLDDFSPEKLKKLKMESRVKEETEKAKRRAGEKIVRGFLEKKGFLDDSHSHRSSRHSVTPEKERADRLAGGRYGRPYHEFWKRSATDTSRMMTFKEFLMSLPDDSEESDEISAKRYAEYKKVFCSEAHKEFFEAHCNEEWFLQKYHPEYQEAKALQRCNDVRQRLDVFLQLLVKGWIDVGLDHVNSKIIRKTLDAAIVLLEGGSYDQLTSLVDLDYYLEERKELEWEERQQKTQEDGAMKDVVKPLMEKQLEEGETSNRPDSTQLEVMQHSKDYRYYFEKQLMLVEDMPDFIGTEVEMTANNVTTEDNGRSLLSSFMVFEPKSKGINEMSLHRASALLLKNIPPTVSQGELDNLLSTLHGGFLRVLLLDPDPNNRYYRHAVASFWHNANLAKVAMTLRGYKLHGADLEVVEYRDYTRRVRMIDGIVADRKVVLRDILTVRSLIHMLDAKYGLWAPPPPCDIADAPIEDVEEGESVEESAGASDAVVKEKLIPSRPLFNIPQLTESVQIPMPGMLNPLLINLDECVGAKVQEVANQQAEKKSKKEIKEIDRDENMIKILDRMLLYLRIVHSVDYYGCRFYEMEDDAPKRVGPIHIRGPQVKTPVGKHLAAHIKDFEEKLKFLFPSTGQLSDVEIKELGAKEIEPEVEKFIYKNIEPTKDGIEQCKLCDKRFTGREFSRLHLMEKHREELSERLQSTFFFNRYLADPNRPCSARFV